MAWTFPIPNVTGYVDLFTYSNEVTNNMFGLGILMIIFVVSFVVSKNLPTEKAFSMACFTTTMTSYFLAILQLVSGEIILIMTLLTALSVFFLYRFGD